MEKEVNNIQNVQVSKRGRVFEPKILQASDVVTFSTAQEKAKQIAALQERILELSLYLPDKLSLLPLNFSKDATKISIYLSEPLFYQDEIEVFLRYYPDRNTGYEHGLNVDTNWRLTFELFSDKELQEDFTRFTKTYPTKAQFYTETSYIFDKQGRFAKITRLPGDMRVKRVAIVDYDGIEKDYLSEMTKEDFILVERALTVIKAQCEDYLKWSKMQIII